MLYTPTQNKVPYANILLIGEPKVGKTLLASTIPHAYFLDLEEGASSTGCYRQTFTKDASGFKTLKRELEALARLKPDEDGLLHHTVGDHELLVGAVVIDSIDELQLVADLTIKKVGLQYWGDMLKLMRGIVTTARRINAHLVCIAHARDVAGDGDAVDVGLALQGGIRSQLPRWFDVLLHLVTLPGGATILTGTTTIGKKTYLAGDRHYAFEGKRYPLRWANGKPDAEIMGTILAATTGGAKEELTVDPDAMAEKLSAEVKGATQSTLNTWPDLKAWIEQQDRDIEEAKAVLQEKHGKWDKAKLDLYQLTLKAHYRNNPLDTD